MNDINYSEDIEKIKNDIKSLVGHLKNVKDKSGESLLEELALLSSTITKFKKDNNDKENDGLLKWCRNCGSILNHPIKNIAYAFAAYAIFSMLFKRDK